MVSGDLSIILYWFIDDWYWFITDLVIHIDMLYILFRSLDIN